MSDQVLLDYWRDAEHQVRSERATIKAAIHGILFRAGLSDRPDFAEIMERIEYNLDSIHALMSRVFELGEKSGCVAPYRPCTFADAERIKASADGVPPLESETNDMLAALNKHGVVIRADGQQAQPE